MNKSQLLWRCRRGVRELDVLFGRFLESTYPDLDNHQQVTFHQLLEVQDPVIMDWLFEKYQPEDLAMRDLISILQELSGIKK